MGFSLMHFTFTMYGFHLQQFCDVNLKIDFLLNILLKIYLFKPLQFRSESNQTQMLGQFPSRLLYSLTILFRSGTAEILSALYASFTQLYCVHYWVFSVCLFVCFCVCVMLS